MPTNPLGATGEAARRLSALAETLIAAPVRPVPICEHLAQQLERGMAIDDEAGLCGEHADAGVMCETCFHVHNKLLPHRVYTPGVTSCVNDGAQTPPPPDGGWTEVRLLDLMVRSEADDKTYRIAEVVLPVNVVDRLCDACRGEMTS